MIGMKMTDGNRIENFAVEIVPHQLFGSAFPAIEKYVLTGKREPNRRMIFPDSRHSGSRTQYF